MTRFAALLPGTPLAASTSGGLVIDWTSFTMYNTIMAVAAGAGLLSVVALARTLSKGREVHPEAWSIALAIPGTILLATGLHMTLVWPLAKYFPFDNIVFGETSLAFGVLLVFGALFLWKRSAAIAGAPDQGVYLARTARPSVPFIVGMGLALIAIAAAGFAFELFVAPPEEPITGFFSQWPWLEITFISGLFGVIGLGAVLFPFALREVVRGGVGTVSRIVGVIWGLAGLALLLFGAMNFFTHIGLIINTTASGG